MPRYKLILEYDGSSFCGWQKQKNRISIQQTLEEALMNITRTPVEVFASGRTDAGVHALKQVAHFNSEKELSPFIIQQATNFHLKSHNISILHAEEVPNDFHARFSAIKRHYIYKIVNRRSPLTINKWRAWHVIKPLNIEIMQEAGNYLIGTHDFSTFRAKECQSKTAIKTVNEIKFFKNEENIEMHINARSFLHHQVRIIIGTIKLVGERTWDVNDFLNAFNAKNRNKAGVTAPPQGLYLSHVEY